MFAWNIIILAATDIPSIFVNVFNAYMNHTEAMYVIMLYQKCFQF